MRFKGKLKLAGTGLLALGGAAGLTAGLVACGSTDPGEGVYYSTILNDQHTATKSDKQLVAWIPWKKDPAYAASAKKWLLDGFGADSSGKITSSTGGLQDYTLDVRFLDSDGPKSISTLSVIEQTVLGGKDNALLPDIVVAYPDIAALFSQSGLLHDFGNEAKDLVAPGFAGDLNSVPTYTGARPNYIIPFSKTTDTSGFDIVVMAKILSDTAKAVAELTPDVKSFKVPANSDNDRMFRMITAPSVVTKDSVTGNVTVDLKMNDIYSDNPNADKDKNVTYNWSQFESAWADKTKAGGIWEADKPVVEANFAYKNTTEAKTALSKIKFNELIFNNYEDIASFSSAILDAYNLAKAADTTKSAYVYGQDSISNAIFSNQYDAAGHSADGFFINTKSVKVNGQEKTGVLRYDLLNPATSKTFNDSIDWLSNEVKKGAVYLKSITAPTAIYSSSLLQKHQLVFATGSTQGTFYYTDQDPYNLSKINVNGVTNVGEVFFALQPTKSKATDTKNSVINQGPSLFVLDSHGTAVGTKIAEQLLQVFRTGANVQTVNNRQSDTGYWGSTGYMYGNKASYVDDLGAPSKFISFLNNLTSNPSNWGYNIGKKILVDYLSKAAQEPDKYDLYSNPVDPHTGSVRDYFDTQYSNAFANYFQDKSSSLPTGKSLAVAFAKNAINDGWFKQADSE